MEPLIRAATVDDAKGVAEVLNAVVAEGATIFDRPFSVSEERDFISSLGDRSVVHVAELAAQIVGVQSVDLFSSVARSMSHVATMGTWLRADARGQGVARRLTELSLRFASRNGYSKIVIQVLASNERALRFYRGLGFADIGLARQQVQLNGAYHDEIYLEKLL
jgi:RimJ/RimL family protein N-acetyltransferase